MNLRRISWTSIRNFIGTESPRISNALSTTSTSRRADAGGSRNSTATYFVPSVSRTLRGHSHRVSPDPLLRPALCGSRPGSGLAVTSFPAITRGGLLSEHCGRTQRHPRSANSSFALRPAELFQRFLVQHLNLRQVSLRFFDVAPDRAELLLDRDLASVV